MPVRFIQAGPTPFLGGGHPGHAAIGVDTDTEELQYRAPGSTAVVRIVPLVNVVTVVLNGATAGLVDGPFFIADAAYKVVKAQEVHSTAGAGSSTLDIKKTTGTTAPASGTTILASVFALDSTVNTVVNKTLSSTVADITLAAGDRLNFDFTGTVTALVGAVSITLRRV